MSTQPTLISSQRYLDDETVATKREARDYAVTVSPAFEVAGDQFQVVLDGHHSLAAALADGAAPELTEATRLTSDRVALLERGEIDDFLAACWIDSDYYVVATGRTAW